MDNRIIDLDLDNPILPDFFNDLKQPINMTMCAGDGVQEGITDIEWFTKKREGYNRENKPTTIFITTKNYSPEKLEKNKTYLRNNRELQVILLVYNDEIPKWKENLIRLFPESINNIYEDSACYGDKLDLKTLYKILREDGIYQMARYLPKVNLFIRELHPYKDYWKYFTIDLDIDLENIPYKIIKNNKGKLIMPSTWQVDANDLERFKLDESDYERRTKAKAKLSNCETNADCKFFGKNGTCELEEKLCYFDSNKGGKKKKTKKSKKTRKNNKTRKTKKRRKH